MLLVCQAGGVVAVGAEDGPDCAGISLQQVKLMQINQTKASGEEAVELRCLRRITHLFVALEAVRVYNDRSRNRRPGRCSLTAVAAHA